MTPSRILLVILTLCATASNVWARNDVTLQQRVGALFDLPFESLLDIQIETATGIRQPLVRAPTVATVITAEDITAIGATDLDEVLETVPGLHVNHFFQLYSPNYVIRGIGGSSSNQQVLVMINGIPVTSAFEGNRGNVWAGMPVNAIARIEVIRGPGSALHGADAFAGVINIVTKSRADITRPEVGLRGGSNDTWDAWFLYGGEWMGFDAAVTFEFRTTDGHGGVINADAQSAFDNLFGTRATLAPDSVALGRDSVDARLDLSHGDYRFRLGYQGRRNLGTGAGTSQALDPRGEYASDRLNTDLTYRRAPDDANWGWEAKMSLYYLTQDVEEDVFLFPPGAFGGSFAEGMIGNPEVEQYQARAGVTGAYEGWADHRLQIGAGINYLDVHRVSEHKNFRFDPVAAVPVPLAEITDVSDTADVFLPEKDRTNWYLLAQDQWQFDAAWELTAGGRYDHYSDVGDTFNPRVALVWQAREDLIAKLLYGRAFRPPSFAELFNMNNPIVLGNPDLEPETIDTIELGLTYDPSRRLRLGFNVFAYEWDDVIRLLQDPPPASTSTFRNQGRQTGAGFETELQWQAADSLRVAGNFAYQRATDERLDEDAGLAPEHQLYLRGDWQFLPKWSLVAEMHWVGDQQRAPGDPRADLQDSVTLNATLRRRSKHWDFAVSAHNLLDEDAKSPSPGPAGGGPVLIPGDLPLAGRRIFAELRYRF